jgi:hypothetical protein
MAVPALLIKLLLLVIIGLDDYQLFEKTKRAIFNNRTEEIGLHSIIEICRQ